MKIKLFMNRSRGLSFVGSFLFLIILINISVVSADSGTIPTSTDEYVVVESSVSLYNPTGYSVQYTEVTCPSGYTLVDTR
ncbi:MAG: hypothetical protein DRP18_02740, partial [Candidatus Aenigmatarchaeota archaeon]